MNKYIPKILKRTQFGNPILQQKSRRLELSEIGTDTVQHLIADMRYTLLQRKLGVGLAAPQVGSDIALSIILIRSRTTSHAHQAVFEEVIINPTYVGIGKKAAKWEGCLSFGSQNSPVFAQAERYESITASWIDSSGQSHTKELSGLPAHVFQHETDHLNGILFPQRVIDHATWMNASEYKKHIVSKRKTQTKN